MSLHNATPFALPNETTTHSFSPYRTKTQLVLGVSFHVQSNRVITNPRRNVLSYVIAGFRYTEILDIFELMELYSRITLN